MRQRFWHQVAFLSLMVAETMTVICRTTSTTTTPLPSFMTGDSGERLVMPKMSPDGSISDEMAELDAYDNGMRPLRLKDILPEDPSTYDKMRPPKKEGRPCTVNFHVTVMSLDSINENSMTYVADVFFAQSWEDHRLRFPENMTSEYRLLEVEWLNELWRPDSFFKNAKQVTFQTMTIPNHYVWLYQNRKILYMVKLTLMLSCPMNFASYPHDTQECKLQMESLSHTVNDLLFEWDPSMPLDVSTSIELPQLELIRYSKADCTQVYSTGNFTCLEAVFTLKRRLGYYLFHTYIPTCLIVIMSWVSFWIKPEAAPARVTLGVTSLLTLSTQHAKSQASLPPVSYIKAIDVFMSSCTVFVFLALMEYALVNILLGDSAAEAAAAKEAAAMKEKLKEEHTSTSPHAAQNKARDSPQQQRCIRHALTTGGAVCTNATGPIMLISANDNAYRQDGDGRDAGGNNNGRQSRGPHQHQHWQATAHQGMLNPLEGEAGIRVSSDQHKKLLHQQHKCDQNWSSSTAVGIGGFGFGLGISAPPPTAQCQGAGFHHQQQQHHAYMHAGHPHPAGHFHHHHHHHHQNPYQHSSQELLSPAPEYEMSTMRISPGSNIHQTHSLPHLAANQHQNFHHQYHHHHHQVVNDNDVSNMSDDPTPSNLEVLIGSNGEEEGSVSITTDNPIVLINRPEDNNKLHHCHHSRIHQQQQTATEAEKNNSGDMMDTDAVEEDISNDKQPLSPEYGQPAAVIRHRQVQQKSKAEGDDAESIGSADNIKNGGGGNNRGSASNDSATIMQALSRTSNRDGRMPALFSRIGGQGNNGGKPNEGLDSVKAAASLRMKNEEMAAAMERRRKALAVDRFSRYFFPFSFSMLNFIYWAAFANLDDGTKP